MPFMGRMTPLKKQHVIQVWGKGKILEGQNGSRHPREQSGLEWFG